MKFSITNESIKVGELASSFSDERAGACVQFEGRVRSQNEGRQVTSLEYEGYEALCLAAFEPIYASAMQQFDVIDIKCVHRVGHLQVGETAVWVAVLAMHRKSAFLACEYVMTTLKKELPIWKKEFYADGTQAWIESCQGCAHHAVV